MKVLIIGNGGREHALAWKVNQSKKVKKIFVAPGNGGTATFCTNIDIKVEEIDKLKSFAQKNKIDLTIVGPEIPLALGIADKFREVGLTIFGPTKKAAQIEASKVFAKKFMKTFNIPTAEFKVFKEYKKAKLFLTTSIFPKVLKADGLAAGKGVIICKNKEQAMDGLAKLMKDKEFGSAGDTVVIEDCLSGEEMSVICITDGKKASVLPIAQDHKRIGDGDRGLNTGGMGTVCPLPKYSKPEFMNKVLGTIIYPALKGMQTLGTPFRGALYAGLMVNGGDIKVLEFNCRFGDPETESQLVLVQNDLCQLLLSCAKGELGRQEIKLKKAFGACVICASEGYPQKYKTGFTINLPKTKASVIFHGGTAVKKSKLVTSGGRVLAVTSIGKTLAAALKKSYETCQKIKFAGKYYRKDIGKKILYGSQD